MSKYTPWFPADAKPARPGVYEIEGALFNRFYRKWDGMTWYCGNRNIERAALSTHVLHGNLNNQKRPWRGLAKEPK